MSLTASARSVPGTLRQEVLIDGRHRLVTDEPESVGGGGSAPAPHELFPAALAACVSTTTRHVCADEELAARRRSRSTSTTTIGRRRDGSRSTSGSTGDLSAEQVERLESVAAKCPVRRAVESGIVFDEHIELQPAHVVHAA